MSSEAVSREVAAGLSECADVLDREADRHALNVTKAIDAAIGGFDHDHALSEPTLAATRSTIRAFAALLRVAEPIEVHASPEALALVRAYVRRSVPLRVLLQTYQLTHARVWKGWLEIVLAQRFDPDVRLEVLTRSTDLLFQLLERVTADAAEFYDSDRELWSRSVAAIRQETVMALLDGQEVDLDRAQQLLVYDLRAVHVGVVLWTRDEAGSADAVNASWSSLVEATQGRSTTAIAGRGGAVWGWISTQRDELDDVLPEPGAWTPPRGVRVASGEPEAGVAGFRSTIHQALEAQRVAELGPVPDPVVRFCDVAIPALITADPMLGETFMRRELGPLTASDKRAVRLRATLTTYFAERESPAYAGTRLGVHVNTVIYRLKQVEELLGIAPADRRLQLELALLLHRFLRPDPEDH